jgi:diguanylate cyclase (GGDEF)-like protein
MHSHLRAHSRRLVYKVMKKSALETKQKINTEGRIPLADLLVFHQLSRSLTSSFNLNTILRTILEHMERMVDAELWTLLMLDETSQELYYAIAAGEEQEALRGLRVKSGEGLAGWVLEHGETLIVPEAPDNALLNQSGAGGKRAVRSAIALPLRGRKGTQGVIEILNPRAEMSDYTIAFLHILADHAAIAIENAHDVSHIQQLTITDDTTGLYNVRYLYNVIERELTLSKKLKLPLSLAFLDLDHFKLVNDLHGHLIGSELLAKAGRRLQELSRKQDLCFRYGGDEFVILMPETDSKNALVHAQAIHSALTNTQFQMTNGLKLSISASVGLATAPADGVQVHAIIGTADARMYAVKRHGRGHVRGT